MRTLAMSLVCLSLPCRAAEAPPPAGRGELQIQVRALSLTLPADEGWSVRRQEMPKGGALHEAERELANGRRMQVHVADYYGPEAALGMQLLMSGAPDAQRLESFIAAALPQIEGAERVLQADWGSVERGPQRRHGAACRERQVVREERHLFGARYRWQDWMLLCIDPVSHLPVQVDYAERYAAGAAGPGAGFAADAAAVFDRVEFAAPGTVPAARATVAAALVMANNRLFGSSDNEDYPAAVVFSVDPQADPTSLLAIAQRVFRLKGTSPADAVELVIARHLTDERPHYTRFWQVPPGIAGGDMVFVGDLVIKRALLPKGHLGAQSGYGDFLFEVLVHPASEHTYRLEHVGIRSAKP